VLGERDYLLCLQKEGWCPRQLLGRRSIGNWGGIARPETVGTGKWAKPNRSLTRGH